MKTHKNPSLRSGPQPFKASPNMGPKPFKAPTAKPATCKLEGKKWLVVCMIWKVKQKIDVGRDLGLVRTEKGNLWVHAIGKRS